MLTAKELASFKENGVLVLRNFYDYEREIRPIQEDIYNIIGIIIDKYTIDMPRVPFNGENFLQGYLDILKINRKWGSEIYDAIKQLPSFLRIASHKKNEALYKQLRNSKSVGIGLGNYGIRIDDPHDQTYKTDWHQEFLTHLRSKDGCVLWSPLNTICADMGPVEVMQCSHNEGILPLSNENTETMKGNYSAYTNGLKIVGIDTLQEKYDAVAPESNPGDLIVLDYLCVHRSGLNESALSRWSMQFRYFNFEDEEGQKIAWSGSFASGKQPRDLYPEYFL